MLASLAACSEGAVHVRVEVPQNQALSPMQRDPARLTLTTERDGEPPQRETRDTPASPQEAPLNFGEITVGANARVSLLAEAASGRMVGFGRTSTPLEVAAGEVLDVTIRLRRPFAYVAGGPALGVFDTTVESGDPFASELAGVAQPTAVTVTPDGGDLLVAASGGLVLVSTSTHARTSAAPVTLRPGASSIAVSPDSRWAVVVHTPEDEADQGLSFIDLEALRRSSTATAAFVKLAGAGAVAVTADTAWALVDPSLPGPPPIFAEDCSRPSKLVAVPLASPMQPRAPIVIAGAARDVAAAPDGLSLLVAQRCQNVVTRVAASGASQLRVFSVPNPNDVAVAGGRVWAVGATGEANAVRLVLSSASLDGSSPSRIDFPLTQELAESNDLAEDGQIAEVRLGADRLDAFALSVLPDGRNVALLVHGSYHADEVVRSGTVLLPRLDLESYEYLLVDATTGIAAQRLRTSCSIEWEQGTALLDDWSCASLPGQETAEVPYIPRQAAVLYGGQ